MPSKLMRLPFTAVIALTVLFFYQGCKKTDLKISQNHELEDKFLTVSSNAPSAVKRIVETIKNQNEKFHFLNNFIKQQGFAKWDKSPLIPKTAGYGVRTQGSKGDTIVIVPLVKLDSARVTAFLACRVNADSVQIKLFRADRYFKYPTSNSTDSLTSTFIAHQTMVLDYLTFGYDRFKITDKRIFNYPGVPAGKDSSRCIILKPANSDRNSRNATFITVMVCWDEWMPPYGYQTGGLAPGETPDYGHYERRCQTYTTYVSTLLQNAPSTDSNNPDYSSGGSGDGSPYFWNSDPCDQDDWNVSTISSDPNPCPNGVIGWQPVPLTKEWFDVLPPYTIDISGLTDYPCAQNIAQSVIQLNNSTIKTIKDIFGESVKYNIYFDANLSDPNSNASSPPYPQWIPIPDGTNGPLTQLDISIHLNPSLLNEATKLSIAEAIIHEMIHGYFYYRSIDAFGDPVKTQKLKEELGFLETYDPNKPPTNSEALQHQQMAQTYIDKIVLALKEYKLITDQDLNDLRNTLNYPNITVDDFYKAMAWSGLYYQDKKSASPDNETQGWHIFKKQNPTLASQYLNIMTMERVATWVAPSHEKCN